MSGRRSSYFDRAILHSSARTRPLALPACAPVIRSSHHHLADTLQCDMGLAKLVHTASSSHTAPCACCGAKCRQDPAVCSAPFAATDGTPLSGVQGRQAPVSDRGHEDGEGLVGAWQSA